MAHTHKYLTSDKGREWKRKDYRKHHESRRIYQNSRPRTEYYKMWWKNRIEILPDGYIAHCLKMRVCDLTPTLIELKKSHIVLTRKIRNYLVNKINPS